MTGVICYSNHSLGGKGSGNNTSELICDTACHLSVKVKSLSGEKFWFITFYPFFIDLKTGSTHYTLGQKSSSASGCITSPLPVCLLTSFRTKEAFLSRVLRQAATLFSCGEHGLMQPRRSQSYQISKWSLFDLSKLLSEVLWLLPTPSSSCIQLKIYLMRIWVWISYDYLAN